MDEEPMEQLEEGEISDGDDPTTYTPLPRPTMANDMNIASTVQRVTVQDDISDTDNQKSSSDSDSDAQMNKAKKPKKSKPLLRHRPDSQAPRVKDKYNVWAASLQDDLMENMRGCDVTHDMRSRDVESYDYSIKYRLNNDTTFKRKRPQSMSEDGTTGYGNYRSGDNKRYRNNAHSHKNRSVKSRLGSRSDSSNSNDSSISAARQILDLAITCESTNEEIARDLANKLCEEKDDLLLRALNTIGKEIPLQIFSETQKIELDGGMMIMNGLRRRTPGGVFLFLLKKHDGLTEEQRREIFLPDRKITEKEKKRVLALKRDKKVEELKKTLTKDKDLPVLGLRKDHLMPETVSTLSNPPPSPVTDCNRENSCDFDDQSIVHVNITSPEKLHNQDDNEEDFLDVNTPCDDMDLF